MIDAQDMVKRAEVAYAAQDLELIKELYDPGVIVYFNGQKMFEGRDQLLRFEAARFALTDDFKVTKTLKAASGDTIAVAWHSSWTDKRNGNHTELHGGEFWTVRDGRLLEWHAHATVYAHKEHDDQADTP